MRGNDTYFPHLGLYGHGMATALQWEIELGERAALALDDLDTFGPLGWYWDWQMKRQAIADQA